MKDVIGRLRRSLATRGPYRPRVYWEGRAQELIAIYDDPESWTRRNWAAAGVEESAVPPLLERSGVRSVFVVGAGSGRQYGYLEPLGLSLRGIDISPTLAAECRRRYPAIETTRDTLLGMEDRHAPADAVLSSAVLQHVPPADFSRAISSVRAMAEMIVVVRELTWMQNSSTHVWAHDYRGAFADWTLVHDKQTDHTENYEVRLLAWTPGAAG